MTIDANDAENITNAFPVGFLTELYFQAFNYGYTAYTACCRLEGGVDLTKNFVEIEDLYAKCIGKCAFCYTSIDVTF